MNLETNKLFNPDADVSERKLIGGNTTGVMILTNNKYSWSSKLYKAMMSNFWIPEEIKLATDAAQYKKLTSDEQDAFDKVISFLVFMDSLLTSALPNIADYVTLPEVRLLLTIHAFQEALHSQSYGYILETVVPAEKRRKIYDIAITDEHLKKRNEHITSYYQMFMDFPTTTNFIRVIFANYLLESLFFYSGFSFFYNLARNGKMTGVGTEIKYINRDEVTHMTLFQNIFKELEKEYPEDFRGFALSEFREMTRVAVEHEIEWSEYAFGDRIQGLSSHLIAQYIKYTANQRLKNLKIEILYPEVTKNPLPFINKMSSFNDTKTDFFEEKPINYSKSGADLDLDGLDDVDL
jgi:ribonucleoside-diphosphate reductase beta chain